MKGKWLRIESLGNLQSSQSITKRTLECCELKDNQLLKTVICAYSLKKCKIIVSCRHHNRNEKKLSNKNPLKASACVCALSSISEHRFERIS